jgi:hypothetical protein
MTNKEFRRHVIYMYGNRLSLDISNGDDRALAEVDSFVAESHGNNSIDYVELHPYGVYQWNYELWDKMGQGVGNLKSLGELVICLGHSWRRLRELKWEILARILPHIQNKIVLRIVGYGSMEGRVEMQAFACYNTI